MLELKNIKKKYSTNNFHQNALNGVSLVFRKNEFVSILGPSGSGKTTMLNIVGGLDEYSIGDLIINGVSTKEYKNLDWDTYRNHHVGFVFQSYNLISHQTVLANVELALTISGVDSKTRKKKAIEVLKEVGLKDHINKKPNQLSGGQMQRVAIARALINDPDILLADEPTGALDSETSVQIMNLLKEIAEKKLVIMVTHNPDLAEEYSTRIVKLLDGKIISDSKPYKPKNNKEEKNDKKGKKFMSFKTALRLSFNNLLTKKGRTFMTAFAGSIGIIGIATILSLSNGVQEYIDSIEEDTLASYPITIQDQNIDASSFMGMMETAKENNTNKKDENVVYSNDMIMDMMSTMTSGIKNNNLEQFKKYLDGSKDIKKYSNYVQYGYDLKLQLYKNEEDKVIKVNPNDLFEEAMKQSPMSSSDVWLEMISDPNVYESKYELLDGKYPTKYDEVMILLDSNGNISDFTLYTLGIKDQDEIKVLQNQIMSGEVIEEPKQSSYTYDELLSLEYKLLLSTDYYEKNKNTWVNKSDDNTYMLSKLDKAPVIKVVGIAKAGDDMSNQTGAVLYHKDLTEYAVNNTNQSNLAKEQINSKDVNVLTGLRFSDGSSFDMNDLSNEEKAYLATLSQSELAEVMKNYSENASMTYETVLKELGIVDLGVPSMINIYPKDFESKEEIQSFIESYNKDQKEDGKEENVISYTDIVGMMMKSVTTIVDMITYVLIAFVSISLIVSSIMIGIITYISVLERTKEIGILRAIGASKKDISRVFNAETFIVGLCSGVIGIGCTLIINLFANIIIKALTDISNLSKLPMGGAISLIVISIILTLIAGLIPSKIASNKKPVEALRTE